MTEIEAVKARLAAKGWRLPDDPLARDIIAEAPKRWGLRRVLAGLERELGGAEPSYALEPMGRALGKEFECPHQLVRISSDRPDDRYHR